MSIGLGAIINKLRGGAAASGAASTAASTAVSNPSIFGKVSRFIMKNKMNTAFIAMSVVPALAMYGSTRDAQANEVKGINWSSGNSAVLKALGKYAGFSILGGATAAIACGAPLVLGAPIAALGAYLGWCKLPEWLEKLFPDEGQKIKKACEEKGIAYNEPSIISSFMGSPSSPEGAMA